MKPLPKWVAWLSTLAALFGAGGTLANVLPPKVGVVLGSAAAVVNAVTHSLPGTGGSPQNP